jgi:hypothetical protein
MVHVSRAGRCGPPKGTPQVARIPEPKDNTHVNIAILFGRGTVCPKRQMHRTAMLSESK